MNRIEFKQVMEKLINEYTIEGRDPPYGPGRVESIYVMFRLYSLSQFEAVVKRAFMECRQAPLAKDLRRIAEEIRKEEYEAQKTLRMISHEEAPLPKEETLQNVSAIIQGLRRRFPGGEEGGQTEIIDSDMREIP